jgi:hypothetical protein
MKKHFCPFNYFFFGFFPLAGRGNLQPAIAARYNRFRRPASSRPLEVDMKKNAFLLLLLLAIFLLVSCAPGPNRLAKTSDGEGRVAGFWLGLWHGLIAPITFIVSLFSDKISLYEVHNSGGWYNFGFVLGAGLFLSGGILGRKKKK